MKWMEEEAEKVSQLQQSEVKGEDLCSYFGYFFCLNWQEVLCEEQEVPLLLFLVTFTNLPAAIK